MTKRPIGCSQGLCERHGTYDKKGILNGEQIMKKIPIVSWAYIIGSYVDKPVEPPHEKAITIMNATELERS